MTIDTTYFGYGVGLVMVGWIAGLAVGTLYKVFTIAKEQFHR